MVSSGVPYEILFEFSPNGTSIFVWYHQVFPMKCYFYFNQMTIIFLWGIVWCSLWNIVWNFTKWNKYFGVISSGVPYEMLFVFDLKWNKLFCMVSSGVPKIFVADTSMFSLPLIVNYCVSFTKFFMMERMECTQHKFCWWPLTFSYISFWLNLSVFPIFWLREHCELSQIVSVWNDKCMSSNFIARNMYVFTQFHLMGIHKVLLEYFWKTIAKLSQILNLG